MKGLCSLMFGNLRGSECLLIVTSSLIVLLLFVESIGQIVLSTIVVAITL